MTDIIIALFTILAVVVSFISLKSVNKHNKTQNFIELVNEYKSIEFLNYIKKIIELRDECEKNNKGLYEFYKLKKMILKKQKELFLNFFKFWNF